MMNITVNSREKKKEQKLKIMNEIRAEVPKLVNIDRLKGNILELLDIREPRELRGEMKRRKISIVLEKKNYTEDDLIVLYYPEIKEMAVQDTVNNSLTYKVEDGLKQVKLPNGYKQAHIILAEAFISG